LTLPAPIYQRMSSFGPGMLPQMAGLSVLIGVLALAGVAVQSLALRERSVRYAGGRMASLGLGRWRVPLGFLAWLVIAVLLLVPLLALVTTSLVPAFGVPLNWHTVTLANFEEVLMRQAATMRAFRNSTLFAGGAALVLALGVIPMAVVMERLSPRSRRLLQGLAELPYALPGIVLAIACILLFLRPLPLVGSLYA